DIRYRLSGIACVSSHLERSVHSRGAEQLTVQRIPCGVPIPRKQRQRENATLKLVYIGRLAEEAKQITLLTKALCQATRLIPGVEAVIYGDGPARDSVEYILQTEGAGLPIRRGGIVDSADVYDVLLENDILILLSDYEGVPVSVMEAMACGLVPVCLDIRSGIPELITNDHNGMIVQDRSDDFLRAIGRLREDTELWNLLARNARATIEQKFSDQVCTLEWVRLFNSVAANGLQRNTQRISRRIVLPAVHPLLKDGDPRAINTPSWPKQAIRHGRMLLGKWRRKLLHRARQ
ncbi:MAG: glycosyltransferase family 4 protein, partial [Planctomycetaceae bacterium]|nr:glycosyltransferase family 4 protein [Planctomycetaceae bacterium]